MNHHTRRLEEGGGMQHFRDALAQVLAEEIEFPVGVLVTVIDAKVTRDTRHAKGVISVFPIAYEEEVIEILKASTRAIKEGLSEKLRLRRIPNLHWTCDETEEHATQIEMILNDLEKEK